jgi:mannose-6-phosphate isomerase class I
LQISRFQELSSILTNSTTHVEKISEFWFWAHPTNYCAVENQNGNCIEQTEIMSMMSELKETRKEIKEMKVILKFFKFISIVMTLLVFLSFFVVLSK